MQKIYIADDAASLLEVLTTYLTQEHFSVESFTNGDDLVNACLNKLPDLVILDVMMPGTDGLSACSLLRSRYPDLPIILISVKDSPYDRVTGLTFGSDDYISKPFLPIELVARVRAVLRRSKTKAAAPPQAAPTDLVFGPLTLKMNLRQAFLSGKPFSLTPAEFNFLAYLMQKENTAASREELLNNLWKVNWQANTRVADDLVKRLRRKLRAEKSGLEIETICGYGFRLTMSGDK